MQSIQENIIVDLILQNTKKVHFSEGLGGVEQVKDFTLSIKPSEAPLIWLTAQNSPNVSFITVDPFLILQEYEPEFAEEDLDALDIQCAEDMLVLCIANLTKQPASGLTLNLKAPIVINWATGQGKQIVIQNQKEYSLEYQPLPNNDLEAA
jgi:flagellar assembly factor FliW